MTNLNPKCSIIIPAYNEEQRLPKTLNTVIDYLNHQSYSWEIIVVDDGSTDKTAIVAQQFINSSTPLLLISHSDGQNHGKGAAVRLGLLKARGCFRLFMDADNSTTIDHIERCWPLFDEGFDVIIGSRSIKGADIRVHQALWREIVGKTGNLFIQLMVVPGITDTQAGFKVFRSSFVENVFPRLVVNGWGFDFEILAVARQLGYRIAQVPITWVNDPESKVRLLDHLQVLGEVVKVKANLIRGVYKS